MNQALLSLGWLLVTVCLLLGINLPMFTFTRFYFFDDTLSLLGLVSRLYQQGELGLFLIIGLFSLVLPLLKMLLLFRLIHAANLSASRRRRKLRWLGWFGKWSMLDVFVVAILVVVLKLGALASVSVQPGLYLFAAAAIGSMLLAQWVGVMGRR